MARTDSSAVAKALDLLTALAEAEGPLRLSELASRVGLHRATAYRSLAELTTRNFVVRDADERYILGWGLLRMTQSPAARHALAAVAWPVLSKLAAEAGRIAGIEVLEREGCRVIDTVRSPRYKRFVGFGGEVFSPWLSGSGLTLLAFSGDAIAADFLGSAEADGLDVEELDTRLQKVRRDGYAFMEGQLDPHIADVAVPLFGAGGHCRAAISVTGFVHDLKEEDAAEVAEQARTAAAELEAILAGGHTETRE